ncbi:MAG: hypothetical protein LUF32_05030 [Clostridiales bacterium]|nr:hypothetical protein [Clostridiales bacterium]
MLKEIYTRLYSETEQGKQSWSEVSARTADLLRQCGGDGVDVCKLEEALTAAGEAGMEQGFILGARFIIELITEAII